MSNNAMAGMYAQIKLGAGSMLECKDWDITPTAKALDATTFDSQSWEEVKMGLRGWSGTFTTQNLSQTSYLGTIIVGSFYTGTAASSLTPVYTGTLMVETMPITVPVADIIHLKFTFKGTGPLTPVIA